MKDLKDLNYLVGKKYNDMTIIEVLPFINEADDRIVVKCRCKCNTIQVVFLEDLERGYVTSCKLCDPILRRIHDTAVTNIKGQRFGHLKVIEETPYRHGSYVLWYCKCDCGRYCFSIVSYLTNGLKKSCGKCSYKFERRISACKKYFSDDERVLGVDVFSHLLDRCYNKNSKSYKYWGNRGIRICDEWLKDRTKFVKWSLANGYRRGLSLDRIDVNGDYSPENCRWTDMITQQNNRSNNHRVTVDGEEHTLSEWARILDVHSDRFYCRPDEVVIRSIRMLQKGKRELDKETYDKFKLERITSSSTYRRYFGDATRVIANDSGNVMIQVEDINQSCTRWDTYFMLPDGYTQKFYKEHGREKTERMISDRLSGKWVNR